ncbi:MAG: CRTAC1 family protein [Deltaproteobacteria bacterium]|nr:CRTAC1 family protein [Deltaproteobacteria bacterium]
MQYRSLYGRAQRGVLLLGLAFSLAGGSNQRSLFLEQGAEWGLTTPITYGGEGQDKAILESTGTGVAVIDYDNDGRPDLFFVNGSRLEEVSSVSAPVSMLYRNVGDGFVDVTEKAAVGHPGWGQGVCVGDYDNDGWTDLYVTHYGYNLLFRNRGGETFEERGRKAGVAGESARWGAGCTFLDYDRDGDLDLFVANYVAYRDLASLVTKPECDWRGMAVTCGPMGLPRDTNILYRNNGDGTFADLSRASGITVTEGHYCFQPITADFDANGWPDIYVSCDMAPNILYRNNEDGTFTDIGVVSGSGLKDGGELQAGMGVAVADFDGDELLDILATNFSQDTPTLYQNLGDWIFADATLVAQLGRYRKYLGWGTVFFDFDNDSWEDLFIVNGHVYRGVDKHGLGSYRQSNLLYRNRGNGTFANISFQGGPAILSKTASRGAATEDFNGDGSLDLVIVNLNEPPSLLMNQNKDGNWLVVKLIGDQSNKSGIGARVVLDISGRRLIREVRSASSYYSSSGLRLHFGLGEAQSVDALEVFWPSGKVDRFDDLAANRVLVIREKEGLTGPPLRDKADATKQVRSPP